MEAILDPSENESNLVRRTPRVKLLLGVLATARGVGGHLILPLLAVVRGTPFLGLVLVKPGEATLAIGSAQASAGTIPWAALFVAAVVGAVASDVLSYALGRTFGEAAVDRITRSRHGHRLSSMLDRSRSLIERRGVFAVAAARPTVISHGVTPVLAGVCGLSPTRFVGAAVVGASLWAAAWLGGAALVIGAVRGGSRGIVFVGIATAFGLAVLAVRKRNRRAVCLGTSS